MTIPAEQDSNHPQTKSFLFLFPEPNVAPSSDNGIGRLFKDRWEEKVKESPLTFVGVYAKSPAFDHGQAETAGNDYTCRVYANFIEKDNDTEGISIFLGSIP